MGPLTIAVDQAVYKMFVYFRRRKKSMNLSEHLAGFSILWSFLSLHSPVYCFTPENTTHFG